MLGVSKYLVLVHLVIIASIIAPPTVLDASSIDSIEEARGTYHYIFEVFENYTVQIQVDYIITGHRPKALYRSWLYLPKDLGNVRINLISGNLTNWSVWETEFYFYIKYIFTFMTNASGGFHIRFNYNMKYGALVVEPEGAFVSPLIGFSPSSKGKAIVILPKYVKLFQSNPPPLYREEKAKLILHYLISQATPRLYILFRVEKAPELINITRPPFLIVAPSRYVNEAQALLNVYCKVYPLIENLTGLKLNNVIIKLFVPKELSEFSILGFVPFDARTSKIGEIHLNVFYIRAIKGILEYGAIHELIHHVLWKLKIMPNILWVHEGLAEYLALRLVEMIDENGTYADGLRWRRDMLLGYINASGTNFYFLQGWRPGYSPVNNILLCYAASYYIFRNIFDEFGLEALKRLFYSIKELNITVSSTSLFIDLLSKAVGQDLTFRFREWHFNIVSLSFILNLISRARNMLKEFNPLSWLAMISYQRAIDSVEKGNYEYALYNARLAYTILLAGRLMIMLAICNLIIVLLLLARWKRLLGAL